MPAMNDHTTSRERLPLNGEWSFYPAAGDRSLAEMAAETPAVIQVPGAWQAQGFGPPGGEIPSSVVGADTTPAAYLRHNLTARCLYARRVAVPGAWQERRVFLCVRRVYRYADVCVNGQPLGGYEGFSSPFELEITDALEFGRENELVIGVDNRARAWRNTVGMGNYFTNTGGFGGDVFLEARSACHLADVFAIPELARGSVCLRVSLQSAVPQTADWRAEAVVFPWRGEGMASEEEAGRASCVALSCDFQLRVQLAPLRLWSPEDPFLYQAVVRLRREGELVDELRVRFGMREITWEGPRLLLNGRPLYLAGYGDDNTEPLTGLAPADKDVYLQRLRLMRGYGFNFVRHHSFFPHDEYLEAADEVGMLVQGEAGMAYPKFWPMAHELFETEWPHLIRAFRNHPCVWAWCTGNELYLHAYDELGAEFTRAHMLAILERTYRTARELDPTRLIHASDGGDAHPWTDVVSDPAHSDPTKPYLLHEYGNYTCTLPDFSLIPRLNGVIRPLTYERMLDFVRKHGLERDYPRFSKASLAMRAEAQKVYLEAARAREDNAGYSFWLGIDFPESPEGCWDEGFLNQLWEPKPGLTEHLPCQTGPTVLLCGIESEKRVVFDDAPLAVPISVSHYGARSLDQGRLTWQLRRGSELLDSGTLALDLIPTGTLKVLGTVRIQPDTAASPQVLTLHCELREGDQLVTGNSWELYTYPRLDPRAAFPGVYSEAGPIPGAVGLEASAPFPSDLKVLITSALTQARHGELIRAGQVAVLLLGAGSFPEIEKRDRYFLNGFGGAFGGVIEEHPVFADLPHPGRISLGIRQLIAGGHLLDAEPMPRCLREGAIVHGLGLTDWVTTEKTPFRAAMLCEVLSGNGLHLMLCNLELLSPDPACQYVLNKMLRYLAAGEPTRHVSRCGTAELEALLT